MLNGLVSLVGLWGVLGVVTGSREGHGAPRSSAAGSLQADVPVTEGQPRSPHGAVTALSAGTGSAFLHHWQRSHPSWEDSVLNLFLAMHGRVGAGEGSAPVRGCSCFREFMACAPHHESRF